MSEPKPFASLSSGLLARKGAAKPAMRPQGFGQLGTGMEDLGWNDMGYAPHVPSENFVPYPEEPREHVPSSIAALTPAPRPQEKAAVKTAGEAPGEAEATAEPAVVEQQRAIEASFAAAGQSARPANGAQPQGTAVTVVSRRPRQAAGSKAKAAFTLRLDPDRHLKLRLACAIRHRSAQQIVSQALDEYLNSLPELEALTDQLPAKSAKRN